MTKLDPMITSYGDLATKSCLRYHKLHWKQAKNVVIQKRFFFPPYFRFFNFFFFIFYQSGSSICRWLIIFWELHRATFTGMCHIVLTSFAICNFNISRHTHNDFTRSIHSEYTCIHLFQQFHFNYTSIHVYIHMR